MSLYERSFCRLDSHRTTTYRRPPPNARHRWCLGRERFGWAPVIPSVERICQRAEHT